MSTTHRYYTIRARFPHRYADRFSAFIDNLYSEQNFSLRGQFLAILMRSFRRTPPADYFHPRKYEPDARAAIPISLKSVFDDLDVPTTIFVYNAVRQFHESPAFREAVLREFASAYPAFTADALRERISAVYGDTLPS